MIPKIIHYFWFGGGKKPEIFYKCLASWKDKAPDFTIMEWNEDNFDIHFCTYSTQAYESKLYAFVSDAARFQILCEQGGIYLDTDVELLKPLDSLLDNQLFMGFEDSRSVAPGLIIGTVPEDPIIKALNREYKSRTFLAEDGLPDKTTVCQITSALLEKSGFHMDGSQQCIDGHTLYPKSYFCPLDFKTGLMNITPDTYTIHHYAATWHDDKSRRQIKYVQKISRVLGYNLAYSLVNAAFTLRYQGIKAFFIKIIRKLN